MISKNNPSILGIATAVPNFCITASNYIEFFSRILMLDDDKQALIKRFVKGSEIQQRYVVLDDFLREPEQWRFFGASREDLFPSTHKRNEIYKQEAPKLALNVADKVLKQWGQDRSEITHIIFISCTGLVAPGIECFLMHELGLSTTVIRTAINFMGCFGALRALSVAQAFAQQSDNTRILIVSTELCSLHIQPNLEIDTIIGNSLFADGAGAMIVGSSPRNGEQALWEIINCAADIVAYDQDVMRWDISDYGFVMRLRSDIPHHIRTNIYSFVQRFVGSMTDSKKFDWAIHPGGKSILHAIEQACMITPQQTESSWHVIRNFGNMSSASIPFVLEHMKNTRKHDFTIGLAFGPGLSAEGILLKNV